MLRDLVKHINSLKDHSASIESGGLRLDGEYFGPDRFDDLPTNCQPHNVQIVNTEHNTTLFAGEWAFLSNMFPCTLIYEGTRFTSSEQCYQFVRARSNKQLNKARRIITSNNAFACKRFGNSGHDAHGWDKKCEMVMTDIIRLKFKQNPHLVDSLLATGDRILQEATSSTVWGIGAGIRLKAAKDNTGTGDNLLGKILMQLRSKLANSNSESDSDSDSDSDTSSCHSEADPAASD